MDPQVRDRIVRESFARQALMRTLGAEIVTVEDGTVEIALPVRPEIGQQHGFVHAGAVAAIADSACGYACLTRRPEGSAVLSVEFKINLLAPAAGDRLVASGKAVRVGRTIATATAEVLAQTAGAPPVLVALMQATMMRVEPKGELAG